MAGLKKSILFIGAHADDIEIGCGATVAKLTRAGHFVYWIILTKENDESVASIRKKETLASASAAGVDVSSVFFFEEADGHLSSGGDVVQRMRSFIKSIKMDPDIIFVHTGQDSHGDHRHSNSLAKSTFRKKIIIEYMIVNSGIYSHFNPNFFVDTSEYQSEKKKMLLAHESQNSAGRILWGNISDADKRYSSYVNGVYCEAFELYFQEGVNVPYDFLNDTNEDKSVQFWSALLNNTFLTMILGRLVPRIDVEYTYGRINQDWETAGLIRESLSSFNSSFFNANKSFKFAELQAQTYEDEIHFQKGSVILIGGSGSNNAVLRYFNNFSDLRYIIKYTSPGYTDMNILDKKTGRKIFAKYHNESNGTKKLLTDYGVLTVMANPYNDTGVVVGLMGIHGFGTYATTQALLKNKNMRDIHEKIFLIRNGSIRGFQAILEVEGSGVKFKELKRKYYEW